MATTEQAERLEQLRLAICALTVEMVDEGASMLQVEHAIDAAITAAEDEYEVLRG